MIGLKIILYFTIQKMETYKVGPLEFMIKSLKNKFNEKKLELSQTLCKIWILCIKKCNYDAEFC